MIAVKQMEMRKTKINKVEEDDRKRGRWSWWPPQKPATRVLRRKLLHWWLFWWRVISVFQIKECLQSYNSTDSTFERGSTLLLCVSIHTVVGYLLTVTQGPHFGR